MCKKILAILLMVCVLLTGCTSGLPSENNSSTQEDTKTALQGESEEDEEVLQISGLNDSKLCDYLEETIYKEVIQELDNEQYLVEDVKATYVSKEYLDEMSYNSQSNIYFGYSLSEIEKVFGNQKYIFTCDDEGKTVVSEYELYDDTFNQIAKNIAIGTGVILVCVTVSVVSGGAGAPAISAIFALSAKTGTILALESAGISAAMTAIVKGVETKNLEETLKQTALSASEGFKFGAITGTVSGGLGELITLGEAAQGGLTLNEAAMIQKSTNLSSKFIKRISSMEEYEELLAISQNGGLALEDMAAVCEATNYPLSAVKLFRTTEEANIYYDKAKLMATTVNGKTALIRDIDLTCESEVAGETVTNLERMKEGYAAIDPLTGEAYELHHIGQKVDSPLAVLTQEEHRSKHNYEILHDSKIADGEGVHSLVNNNEWAAQRQEFWKGMYELLK